MCRFGTPDRERPVLSQSVRLILAAGIVLRVALTVLTPADKAYDNHVEPVQKILSTARIPDAADCWECYQPPVYYLLSAGAWSVAQWGALGLGASPTTAEALGRKMLQWISCAAGVGTLVLAGRILRWSGIRGGVQAAALGLICFLPSHIRMSAMATNDALTYFFATAAVLAALWTARCDWALWPCVACGSLAGLAVCTKAYGAVSVAAIVAAIAVARLVALGEAASGGAGAARLTARGSWRRLLTTLQPAGVVLAAALLTGSGPAIRNLLTFGRPHVDNFDFFDTPMRFQPPGSAAAIDFGSLRFAALLQSPWLHTAHLDSFWSEIYGRLWFDYEGFHSSLSGYPGWEAHWKSCAEAHPRWSRKRWEMLLSYGPEDVPPHFAWLARLQYVAGLPLTALVLLGLLRGTCVTGRTGWRALRAVLGREASTARAASASQSASSTDPVRPPATATQAEGTRSAVISFATVLLALHFWAAICVPVVQSLRLPHFAAMKEAFSLSALASIAAAAAWGLRCAGRRSARVLPIAAVALALVVGVSQGLYVLLIALRSPAP